VTGRRLRCLDVPFDGCCEVRASLRRAGAASREFFERQPALMGELWTHYLHLRKTGALADPPVEVWPFADAPGPASRRTPTQPRQERTEPPYVASVYDATSSCASIRSSSEAARSCLMVIAMQ
jgi:hypothetical protein